MRNAAAMYVENSDGCFLAAKCVVKTSGGYF